MTFRHVVMFKWADNVDSAHVQAVAAGLDKLSKEVPGITGYLHGADAGVSDANYDYVVVGEFESLDDYLIYRDHAVHQAFLADFIVGRVAERCAVQFES